jgi:hypothetical protein
MSLRAHATADPDFAQQRLNPETHESQDPERCQSDQCPPLKLKMPAEPPYWGEAVLEHRPFAGHGVTAGSPERCLHHSRKCSIVHPVTNQQIDRSGRMLENTHVDRVVWLQAAAETSRYLIIHDAHHPGPGGIVVSGVNTPSDWLSVLELTRGQTPADHGDSWCIPVVRGSDSPPSEHRQSHQLERVRTDDLVGCRLHPDRDLHPGLGTTAAIGQHDSDVPQPAQRAGTRQTDRVHTGRLQVIEQAPETRGALLGCTGIDRDRRNQAFAGAGYLHRL